MKGKNLREADERRSLTIADIWTQSPSMKRCLKLAELAASSEVPVLVLGESGVGKTILAQAIHNSSSRQQAQLVSFNSSAISDTLLESQLFGHEKGAFTGANRSVKGKFEQADKGTLFLDEIADMSLSAQAKILRAVEYGEFERLGSEKMMHANARIISATNVSLRQRIREGRFREDLYHRLNGLSLIIPPLRERLEDLPALISLELKNASEQSGRHIETIHAEAMQQLLDHDWPGNLRELHHTLRTAALFCEDGEITPDSLFFQQEWGGAGTTSMAPDRHQTTPVAHSDKLGDVVRSHLMATYERCGFNQVETAKRLGIARSTLVRHLREAGQAD
ncbi:MAG: sigma-54 dependent transcriptional regulator [Desulfofustis sp.]|jgi:DNA-binding NtrC family response regulator|nr:sigma-54 dependent transcriptional regulator [Desulfofustis sp.]